MFSEEDEKYIPICFYLAEFIQLYLVHQICLAESGAVTRPSDPTPTDVVDDRATPLTAAVGRLLHPSVGCSKSSISLFEPIF